ncbi:Short branched chain specific acyl-mitochondrial [Fasciola hepatica]|uniref:Short/branched chain specific acyl-CoA dehydrogenase, mitochondrial n=1 Tax=Fasciola hepatica TaxID=6192 RepID=A0A4E0RW61_FASHE|nr:Short branched chain specific acyl-mitochondrial [Fasciola hepatica]
MFKTMFRFNYCGTVSRCISFLHTSIRPLSAANFASGVSTLLSEDEKVIQSICMPLSLQTNNSASKFAVDHIFPIVSKMDRQGFIEPSLIHELFEAGLMGIEIPSNFGGSDLNFVCSLIAIEEISKVDPSVAILVDVQNTLVITLLKKLGTMEQKEQWLPRLAHDTIGAFCLSEADSGSDAFSMRTVAKKDGTDFILNGSKMWISNSAEAGLFIVMANANPLAGYKGITTFLVPREAPGLTIGKKERKLGLRASSTCQVHFDGVRIPSTSVLGEVGQGYRYAIEMLNEGRIGIGAQMLGLAEGCFSHALNYVRERKQFGVHIWDFQAIQHQFAEEAIQLAAARAFVYNTARRKEAGFPIQKEAAMVKHFTSNMACRIASRAVDWLGGVGFTEDYPMEKFYRDVKIGTIYEGTNNIQLNTIAKCIDKELS